MLHWKLAIAKANLIKKTKWIKILNKKKLGPNKNHNFTSKNKFSFNYIKLKIFPDGGIARIRLFGKNRYEKSKYW